VSRRELGFVVEYIVYKIEEPVVEVGDGMDLLYILLLYVALYHV